MTHASQRAIDHYIERIDPSCSRDGAKTALLALLRSGKSIGNTRGDAYRYLSNGIILVVDKANTITTCYPEPRRGEEAPEDAEYTRAPGRFVALEGIDGAGKSTLWEALRTARPGWVFLQCNRTTVFGLEARKLIEQRANDYAIQAAMLADKFVLSTTVREAVRQGRTVVVDRWLESAFAYAPDLAMWLSAPSEALAQPSLTLLLDLHLDAAMLRLGTRASTDAFETAVRIGTAQRHYRARAAGYPNAWHVLDATMPPERVLAQALSAIEAT